MTDPRPRAAIDCGTNSTRLLVDDGAGTTLVRELTITRLGEDVDRTGELQPAALHRTIDAIRWYAQRWEAFGVDPSRVRIAATSAARDATNGQEFTDAVLHHTGVEVEVLTGAEEAVLSFDGATSAVDVDGPVVVLDIGGGSTEVVLGGAGAAPVGWSMQLGSVRVTERHLADDPPTVEQIEAARGMVGDAIAAADDELRSQGGDPDRAATVVGVAGTVTTVAALVAGHGVWEDGRVHGMRLSSDNVSTWTQRLLAMPVEQRQALDAVQHGREDVIAAGALVLDTFLRHRGVDHLVVSEADILDGLVRSIA